MKKLLLLITTCFVLLLLPCASFASSSADTYGFSPKGISLGNAMCARTNGWDSAYYNIAGLGKSYGDAKYNNQLGFGYINNNPGFDIDINRYKDEDPGQPLATDGDKDLGTGTLVVGMALDIQQIFMELPFVSTCRMGVSVGINDDLTAVKINDLDPRTHNFMRYGRETQNLTLWNGVGAGFLNDSIGFGFGVNAAFGGDGTVMLTDVELTHEERLPPSNSRMDMKMEQNIIAGFYLSPGRMMPAFEGLEFGLAYRQESELNIFPFRTATETALGQIPLNMALSLQDFYQPHITTFGVSYTMQKLQVSFDVEHQMWSEYKPSANQLEHYGSELKDLDDIIVTKLGVEYKLSDHLSLLSGYYYQPSFIPDSVVAGRVNWLDNDKHVGSLGFSLTMPDRFMHVKGQMEINGGCQIQHLVERDVTKASPTSENPNYSYGGTAYSFFLGGSLSL